MTGPSSSLTFRDNVPHAKRGLGLAQASFAGGRLCATMGSHGGLTKIDYYGEQRFGGARLFTGNEISAWTQMFRLCLGIDDKLYYLELTDTDLFPFGYTSHFTAGDVIVRHGLYLLNDALVQRVEVLRNPKKRAISAVLFHMPFTAHAGSPERRWIDLSVISRDNAWEMTALDRHRKPDKSGSLYGKTFHTRQVDQAKTYVAVTSDRPLRFEQVNPFKRNLRSARFTSEATFTLVFGHKGRAAFRRRIRQLRRTAGSEVDDLLARYRAGLQRPALHYPEPAVQSFVANTRAMMDAMKAKDIPGGARGSNNAYWIWGWDSMVYGHMHGLLNDAAFGVEMLQFYGRYAGSKVGIPHSITHDMKPWLPMVFGAQVLYSILLYDVFMVGGDRAVLRRYFKAALDLVNRTGQEEVRGTGLVRGFSVYPDAVDTLGETGDDLSAMNNSIYYQALRGMEVLARELGRTEIAADLKSRADRLRKNFRRFFDHRAGFFVTSLDATTLKPRKFYGAHAVFWVTPFARDLVEPHARELGRFITENLVMRHGHRLMPAWDAGYMRDGNNNGYYDPYVERFYVEVAKLNHRRTGIDHFTSDVAWYWRQFTVPEAMTAEMENHGITVDDPGKQQLFSMKAWCSIFFHTLAGFELDAEGLSFTACDGEPLAIDGLPIRGKRVDFKVAGRGWHIDRLLLDGKPAGRASSHSLCRAKTAFPHSTPPYDQAPLPMKTKLRLLVLTLLGLIPITLPAMTVNLALPYNTKTSGPRSDFPVIFYAPEQPNFLFDHGDTVDIWMQSTNRALKIEWGLCRNMAETPFITGTVLPAMDESFKISIPTAGLQPGFYNVNVKVIMTATQSMNVTSVFGWKADEIQFVNVVPKDFESYWKGEKAKVDATPLDLHVVLDHKMTSAEISKYNVEHAALPEDYDPEGEKVQEIEVYKVDWASPVGPGKRTYGWFAKPVGPGPFPTLLVLPGAGNNPRPIPAEHARHGFASLDVNVHNDKVDMTDDQYRKMDYGRPFTTPDDYWAHEVYLNAMQAVDALVLLPGVDKNKIAVMGGSQGGRATVVVAAMDPRIKAAIPAIAHFDNVPYLSWIQGLNKAHDPGNRPFTEKDVVNDDAMRVQSYYDVANFAPWIKSSVLMNAGLIDGASYPMGTFQVFHNLKQAKSKKIIPMPNIAHDWSPYFDRYAWRWLDETLGEPVSPTPPQSTIDLHPKP